MGPQSPDGVACGLADEVAPRSVVGSHPMMPNLQLVLRRVNELRDHGHIRQYAVGGAWAVTYFSEPVPTDDLDVFCHLPANSLLISLSPIYDYLKGLGYESADGQHADSVMVEGIPVQFLVGNALIDEAIDNAIEIEFMGERTRLFDLEYVMAIALDVGRSKDLSRIDMMLQTTTRPIDTERLHSILGRHVPDKPKSGEKSLLDRWRRYKEARDAAT